MSVLMSATAHASISSEHSGPISLSDGLAASGATSHHQHGATSGKAKQLDSKAGSANDGKGPGEVCKLKCAFSMIVPIGHDAVAAHASPVWVVMPDVALLPGEIVPALRPPRS
jgi:hypothetical protein